MTIPRYSDFWPWHIWCFMNCCRTLSISRKKLSGILWVKINKPPGCPPPVLTMGCTVPDTPYMKTTHRVWRIIFSCFLVATIVNFSIGGRGAWECHIYIYMYCCGLYHSSCFSGVWLWRHFLLVCRNELANLQRVLIWQGVWLWRHFLLVCRNELANQKVCIWQRRERPNEP